MFELPPSVPPPENLKKELVQHLSKEIETTANNMMLFRTRIGFSLCIGPFLLLGSLIIGAQGQPVATNFKWYGWPALFVVVVCYLGIAYMGSLIELHALRQCDRWRTLIREICQTPSMEIDNTKLDLNLLWGIPFLGRIPILGRIPFFRQKRNGVQSAYMVGYLLLFVGVIAAVFIVSAGTPGPANRIEQVTPTPQASGDRK